MITIFVTDEGGNRREITDLYWFEENGVHDFSGEGFGEIFYIELFVDGVRVFPSNIHFERT